MKRNKILFVIALVAVLAMLFVACDENVPTPEHTHTYGAWSITTDPTDTTDGIASRVCACGDNDHVTVAKLSDTSVWSVVISQGATHASNGFAVYKSEYGTITTSSAQGSHEYGAWTITKDPTMDSVGSAIKLCSCGHSVVEEVPVLSNNIWTKDESNKPSHTSQGSVVYTSDYGTVTIIVPADAHVYGKWIDNGNGMHTHYCSCNESESAAHSFDQRVANSSTKKSDATCTTGAEYYYSCVCGAVSTTDTFFSGEGTGHEFSQFTLNVAPTCTQTGLASVKCKKCDYENDNSVIAALGHSWDNVWHPYFATSTSQDENTGETETTTDETSAHHAHKCTVCGEYDLTNKIEHSFGDAYLVAKKDNAYTQMSTEHACECGYTEQVNDNLGYFEYWTLVDSKAPTYNEAGFEKRTHNEYEYTLVIPKLSAPYDSKTYNFVSISLSGDKSIGQASVYSWTGASVMFDNNGFGIGSAHPIKGENKVSMIDATTGKIIWTITDAENKVTTYNGYVDLNTGIVVISKDNPFTDTVYIGSWFEDGALAQSAFNGSVWGANMAVSYSHNCAIGEHEFNIYINDDGEVSFDVNFVDALGNKIAAGDIHSSNYAKIQKGDAVLGKFAKNSAGDLIATDGLEGTYATSDGTQVAIDGIGGISISTSGSAIQNGTYTAVEGKDYYDIYIMSDGAKVAYKQIALDADDMSCAITTPMTTVNYVTEFGTIDDSFKSVNTNIEFTLPTLDLDIATTGGKVFMGWKLQGATSDEHITKYVPTTQEITFVADWITDFDNINLVDAQGGNKTISIPTGSTVLTNLPEYTTETILNGYIFQDWTIDENNNGIADEDEGSLDGFTTISGDMSIIAVWSWAGNVTFEEQTGYTFVYDPANGYWISNNKGIDSSTAVMEIVAESGIVSISFDYYCESESVNFDYMDIYYGPTWINVTTGGKACDWAWKSISTVLDASSEEGTQRIRFTYHKDSSTAGGSDTAYIRNLKINGIDVVVQQPLNKDIVGTYASGDTTVVVGAGGLVTINGEATSYTTVDTNKISVILADVYKEITLDKTNGTCTIFVPQVNVTYDLGGHGDNSTTPVNKMTEQTLASAPSASGYVFRGWYTDAEFTTQAPSTFIVSADVTFYAKWDRAVTITYVYNDGGAHANTINTDYYANDEVAQLQSVDFNYGTKVFVGWFTQDGSASGNWGDEYAVGTIITENITLYAMWTEPSPFAGTYTMLRFYNDATGAADVWNSDTQKLVIDALGEGTVTAWNGFSNGYKVTIKFVEGSTSVVEITANTSKYYGVYDATSGVIVRANSSTGFGNTIFMMVPYNANYVKADFSAFTWNEVGVCHKLISFADRNASNVVRTIYVADETTVAFDAIWEAKDANYVAVEDLANVKTNASMLDITDGDTLYSYAKNASGKFVVLSDEYQGKYFDGEDYIVLNGVGVIAFKDGTSGTYTIEDDGTISALTSSANYTIIVDKADHSFIKEDNKVTITYVNDKKSVDSASVYNGIKYTLVTDGLDVDGFVFRGWYDNAEFTGSKVTSVTPAENKTYYAKYDAAVTLTFDYNGYTDATDSKTSYTVNGKYVNDTVGTLPTVLDDAKLGTKVFAGWFTANGADGKWGTAAKTSDTLSGNTTYYAKWIEPAVAAGTYKGFEIWSATSGKSTTTLSSTVLTLNPDGTFSGIRDIKGSLSNDDFNKANGAINLTRYAYVTDAFGGIVIVGYSNNATSVGTDYYIGFKNHANITKVDYSADSFGGIYTSWITVEYKDGDVTRTINLFVYEDQIVADVSWTPETSAKDCAKASSLIMSKDGSAFLKKDGNAIVGNDGMNGTYTTDGNVLGSIVLDGYGTVTIGENSAAYTLADNTITFVYNNRMYVLTLDKSAGKYTQAQDGYQGTYTMPDGTTITLDGWGTVTGTTQTYVVSGATITIYNGETSADYGIDKANNALLGKSIFAGLTFTGSYYDEWEEDNSTIKFIFDDSSALTGTIQSGPNGSHKAKFTATFDGTTLVMTITESISGGGSGWVGKTLTATLSGNTFTITGWTGAYSNGTYSFANNGSVSCPDYAA